MATTTARSAVSSLTSKAAQTLHHTRIALKHLFTISDVVVNFKSPIKLLTSRISDGLHQSKSPSASSVTPERVLQSVYAGIALEEFPKENLVLMSLSVNDGHFNVDYCNARFCLREMDNESFENVLGDIVGMLDNYARVHDYRVVGVGLDTSVCDLSGSFRRLPIRLWQEIDAQGWLFSLSGSTVDERGDSAARKCVRGYSHFPSVPHLEIGFRNEVLVDSNCIRIADLSDYESTVTHSSWKIVNVLARSLKQDQISIVYMNATPQGGGVALMRHSLIRLLKLLGVEAAWYVPKPCPAVFRITKDMHNLLQGVSEKNLYIPEKSLDLYEDWCRQNCERFWVDGIFKTADVIVLDDPQVIGYIPFIKMVNSDVKIIFRCHIEIRADLVDDPMSPQHALFDKYFYQKFLHLVDLFIFHPICQFIPSCVPREKTVLMPACTDPLDGLNKGLSPSVMDYWFSVLARCCYDQGSHTLDWRNRPYIVQIARFDPSKGIPDVIEAYRKLCEMLHDEWEGIRVPQLLICGHGSIDDPDAIIVYDEIIEQLKGYKYRRVETDVCVVRLPPCDVLLNCALRGSRVTLQLSHREGFEVKVTESLVKGIPVIAYKAGGIPLQIRHNISGFLVDTIGDTTTVAQHLYDLITNESLYNQMSSAAKADIGEDYFTVFNTINWLWCCRVISKTKLHSFSVAAETDFDPLMAKVDDSLDSDSINLGGRIWVKESWQSVFK